MMRRIHFGALLFILAIATLAHAQDKAKSGAAGKKDEVDWVKLDHKWLDSERLSDFAFLDKFFAPSYVLVFPNGETYTKDQWLGILKGPDHPTIEFLNPEDIKVHVFGNVAILTDHTTLKGHDAKGKSMDGVFNVFRVAIKENGEWHATGVVMNAVAEKK
jgi:ketosteroid isomerase-like protein